MSAALALCRWSGHDDALVTVGVAYVDPTGAGPGTGTDDVIWSPPLPAYTGVRMDVHRTVMTTFAWACSVSR